MTADERDLVQAAAAWHTAEAAARRLGASRRNDSAVRCSPRMRTQALQRASRARREAENAALYHTRIAAALRAAAEGASLGADACDGLAEYRTHLANARGLQRVNRQMATMLGMRSPYSARDVETGERTTDASLATIDALIARQR